MLKNFMTIKKFREKYYIVPKSLKEAKLYNLGFYVNVKKLGIILDKIDMFNTEESEITNLLLKTGYICYSNDDKKVSEELEEQIKKDTGSVRALAKKYNLAIGTISKIKNDKYR